MDIEIKIVSYPCPQQGRADVDIKNNRQQTPLQLAVTQGHVPLVMLLINEGSETHLYLSDVLVHSITFCTSWFGYVIIVWGTCSRRCERRGRGWRLKSPSGVDAERRPHRFRHPRASCTGQPQPHSVENSQEFFQMKFVLFMHWKTLEITTKHFPCADMCSTGPRQRGRLQQNQRSNRVLLGSTRRGYIQEKSAGQDTT